MKERFWRKALAAATSVLMLSGGVPITPLSQVFEDIAVTASAEGTTVDLSLLTGNYTAQDGDVLTGSTSGTVTIADNAKITLSDVTITGGIVCSGTAEITLVGTNSVSGATHMAGIQVGGSGTTLTIKGNGSLTANGGRLSAGIGVRSALSNYDESNVSGGNIVIEGGNIVAQSGGWGAAGIGTGCTFERISSIGTITIKGGTVTATGGADANGIGNGYAYGGGTSSVGTITFYDSIDLIDASSISDFGSVVYVHGETDITANTSDYFTIIEDGNRRIITPKDDTDYIITIADDIEHGTLTGAATAKYGEEVTITVTPDFGYRFSRLLVKDADNNDVATTGNAFLMPKGNVTVSAVFEEGTHGTTEFKLRYSTDEGLQYESFYDGVTTINLQQNRSYKILKYDNESSYRNFLLDNSTYEAKIPYSSGTGTFTYGNGTTFNINSGESGFYDITMTDVGNGKWSVSILKTVGVIDNIPDQTYTGSEITPEPLVLAGSLNLTKGTDYEYSYTDNTNFGTAKVIVTFKGDYAWLGIVEKEFKIKATPTDLTGECGDHAFWCFDEETGKLTISGTGAMSDYLLNGTQPWHNYKPNITSVEIENDITSIGYSAFYDCTGLPSITIPDSVTSIGNKAFKNCESLTSITIPDSVTSIGKDAFFGCTNITDVYCYANPANLTWDEDGCDDFILPSNCKMTVCHVPERYLEGYNTKFGAGSENPVNVTFKGDLSTVDMGLGEHLYGYSVSVEGDIGVNFFVELNNALLTSNTAKMVFTVPNGKKTETQTLLVKDVVAKDSNKVVSGDKTYYVFKCSVSAKDMASDITVQLVDGEQSGNKYTCSVKAYADQLLAAPGKYFAEGKAEKGAAFVRAMLSYGSYAQKYFNEGTPLADSYKAAMDDVYVPADFAYNDTNIPLPDGVTFEGATLSLKSETTLSLYFKGLPADTTFTCTAGNEVQTEPNGEYVVARIRGIKANELENYFTVTFGNGGSVTYNAMTYCYNVLKDDTVDDNLQNVCRALYLYAQAAINYAG